MNDLKFVLLLKTTTVCLQLSLFIGSIGRVYRRGNIVGDFDSFKRKEWQLLYARVYILPFGSVLVCFDTK